MRELTLRGMDALAVVLVLAVLMLFLLWLVSKASAKSKPPAADLDRGVHDLTKVLSDLEAMSESDLRWLLNETKDLSMLDVHTAAQTRVIHQQIRHLLGKDTGHPKLGQRPRPKSQPAGQQHRPPGYVYLLKMYGVTKVGVTSDVDRRLKEHRRNGWKQVRVWKVRDIETARRIERSCLQTARNLGALLTDEQLRGIMPQGGYTEVTRMSTDHLERLITEQVNR